MREHALCVALCLISTPSLGGEGASSHYLPGASGDMLLAVPPQPGLIFVNTIWYQSGSVEEAVLQGQVDLGLDLDLVLNLAALSYTFDTPVLGGRYTMAAVLPFGYAELDATLTGPMGGRVGSSDDSFALSDAALIPIQLNWNRGLVSYKFSQSIIAPTGEYSTDNLVNLGRNYWSFDTNFAITWFNPTAGWEVSVAPGFMINTENNDTDYRTGNEFHMDFTATKFFSPTFAAGLRGYWYQQVSGDSGNGALLGDFKGESVGIGAGFLWTPSAGNGQLSILGKFMTDVHSKNRFDSDYVTLTAAWTF